jgi:hypothetical protein
MTRIEIFIATSDLFEIVFNLIKNDPNIKLVFQRFESNQHKAGFSVIDITSKANLSQLYNEGDFSLAYLSLKGIPSYEQDWNFLDKNEEYLIEIAGGRQRNHDLEETVIRLLSKNTKCKPVFAQLLKNIEAASNKGVLLNEQPYPKIFYHRNVSNLTLWVDLESKTIRGQIPA